MGFGLGIILTAAGAILAWAVKAEAKSFDVQTVGYILLVVGIVAIVISAIFWSSWAGPGYFRSRRTVVEREEPRRRVVEVHDDLS